MILVDRNKTTNLSLIIGAFGVGSLLCFTGCFATPIEHIHSGEAQGTTYVIKYYGEKNVSQIEVDSVIESMDSEMNTWRTDSRISEINRFTREDTVYAFLDKSKIWSVLWDLSWEIHNDSDGAFDPTVKPLVDLWGFGLKNVNNVDSTEVDSIMQFIGFTSDKIDMDEVETKFKYIESHIIKADGRVQLDFNAIAQGYTVDMLIDLLVEAGVENAMVEVGGEVRCVGHNKEGEPWKIAVDKPVAIGEFGGRPLQAILEIKDAAVCTSGNYRKFVEINGEKYSHTIDPRTGYPSKHRLLSVTIQAGNAAIADAYATVCMVLGPEEGKEFILNMIDQEKSSNLEALFILDAENGNDDAEPYEFWSTDGWSKAITWL